MQRNAAWYVKKWEYLGSTIGFNTTYCYPLEKEGLAGR